MYYVNEIKILKNTLLKRGNASITYCWMVFVQTHAFPEVLAGSILQIEPKRFYSGYKPEPAHQTTPSIPLC